MKRDHAAFDALSGAVALGEATPAERERFAEHSRRCPTCRYDGEAHAFIDDLVVRARDGETWRPSIAAPVMNTIRETRLRRSRLTLHALTWSLAVSIVLDAAFVSGVASSVGRAARATSRSMTSVVASYRANVP